MTSFEYELTFCQWCNRTKGTEIITTSFGEYIYNPDNKKLYEESKQKYYDEWMAQRKDYVLKEKEFAISNALMTLKNAGVEATLANHQNACIKARARNGRKYTYYATTGTIAGYRGTSVDGLDELIRMLKA